MRRNGVRDSVGSTQKPISMFFGNSGLDKLGGLSCARPRDRESSGVFNIVHRVVLQIGLWPRAVSPRLILRSIQSHSIGEHTRPRVSTGASPVESSMKTMVLSRDGSVRLNVVGEGADHCTRGACAPVWPVENAG
jgi:hypothetical protein